MLVFLFVFGVLGSEFFPEKKSEKHRGPCAAMSGAVRECDVQGRRRGMREMRRLRL